MKAPKDTPFLDPARALLTDGQPDNASATAPKQAAEQANSQCTQADTTRDLVASFMEMPVEEDLAEVASPNEPIKQASAPDDLVAAFLEMPVDLDVNEQITVQPPELEVIEGGAAKRAGAIRVAAVASAGVVLPLASDAVAATSYTLPSGDLDGNTIQVSQARRFGTDALGQGEGVLPTVAMGGTAAFSDRISQSALPPMPTSAVATSPVSQSVSTAAQLPLLAKGTDGNWTLSYHPMSASPETQMAVAQVAQRASQVSADCSGADCGRMEYIATQIPKASNRVQTLQQEVAEFEAAHGQSDIKAYQRVLSDRIQEMSRQNAQLLNGLEDTRQRIAHLKMQLVTVNADLGMAERVLAQDTTYQTVWERVQLAEEKLIEEYSKADLDKTVLHEAYSDYEYHQKLLQRAAQEALGTYLLDPSVSAPSFIYRAPASLDIMQALVLRTHNYKVQQLRQKTIRTIEQRLLNRQSQLTAKWGEYENKQRELKTAQNVLDQYGQNLSELQSRGRGGAAEATTAGWTQTGSDALTKARLLVPELADGTVAKALLGIVVAAGAVAAVAAKRHAEKPYEVPTLEIRPLPPLAIEPAMDLNGLEDIGDVIEVPVEAAEVAGFQEEDLLVELMSLTEQPSTKQAPQMILPMIPIEISVESADQTLIEADLAVEELSRELDEILAQDISPTELDEALDVRQLDPVTISLDEIDTFAEEAIRWVLQDVGLEETVLAQDDAALVGAVRAGVRSQQKQLQPAA